jgi:hypothetical protein
MRSRASSIPFSVVFALVLLLAFGLRSYALEADAPHHLSVSQGLTTDGANAVFGGRNKVLFGQWSPALSGYAAVDRSRSAMHWLSFVFFSLLGIGYWQGGFLAVLISVLTISFVTAFAKQHFGRNVALFATLFLTTNYALLVYNRLPVTYTLVCLIMAMILYCLGRSRDNVLFLAISVALAIFGIVYVKIATVGSLPMVIIGVSIVIHHRFLVGKATKAGILLLFGLLAIVAVLFMSIGPRGGYFLRLLQERYINIDFGLIEYFRFLVTSFLEFGIYSAFFIRMLPLFGLSFGYVLFRTAQFSSKKIPGVSFGETIALMYLLGVTVILLLSNQQPARQLILLIPPMSLISAMAVEKLLRIRRLKTSPNPGYFFPIVVLVGLTYLFYQVAAAGYRGTVALKMGKGVGEYSTITPMPTLHSIMFTTLILALFATFLTLIHLSGSGQWLNSLLTRDRIRILVLFLVAAQISGDLLQYSAWARAPEYSIVAASRQIKEDMGEGVVLGGAYAAVLGMENDYPGILFFEDRLRNPEFQQRVLKSGMTHIAMEAESVFGDIPINDQLMREHAPEFVSHLQLSQTYYVRGYYVKVYEIE